MGSEMCCGAENIPNDTKRKPLPRRGKRNSMRKDLCISIPAEKFVNKKVQNTIKDKKDKPEQQAGQNYNSNENFGRF